MKNRLTVICLIAAAFAAVGPQTACADDPTNAAPAEPGRKQLREDWQKLTPEEQQARLKAMRAQRADPSRESVGKLKEELRGLSPAEREAKMKEFRQQHGLPGDAEMQKRREELSKLSPEERRARIQEWHRQNTNAVPAQKAVAEQRRALMKERLETLRAKKASGTLTPQEAQQLERMERAVKLMQAPPAATRPEEKAAPTPDSPKN